MAATRYHIAGRLAPSEDREALRDALMQGAAPVLDGTRKLLTHADADPHVSDAEREAMRERMVERLREGTLKRFVYALDTSMGMRIIKVAQPKGLGKQLLGFFGSTARTEHYHQERARALGLAACESSGFLEARRGPALIRAIQVQIPVPSRLKPLSAVLAEQLKQRGGDALLDLADAVAATHRKPFFHADLKGFHAFVDPETGLRELKWVDLHRVSFYMTRRKRVINLYQVLRFVIPNEPEAQQRFVNAYCAASGWYRNNPERALHVVRRFLQHKLKTHPNALH